MIFIISNVYRLSAIHVLIYRVIRYVMKYLATQALSEINTYRLIYVFKNMKSYFHYVTIISNLPFLYSLVFDNA